jgi:uridine kinase
MPTVAEVAATVVADRRHQRVLVAVDGGDGSGKTTYAAHLATAVQQLGRPALVLHADDFLMVRGVRHRRGRNSPEGYLDDSYDYDALTTDVLEPLSRKGNGQFRRACIDRCRDVRITPPLEQAALGTIAIVEGLFLLRNELAHWWDYTIFLDVPFELALWRKSRRDGIALAPNAPLTRRYVGGQLIYRQRHRPLDRATWVVCPEDHSPTSGGPPRPP